LTSAFYLYLSGRQPVTYLSLNLQPDQVCTYPGEEHSKDRHEGDGGVPVFAVPAVVAVQVAAGELLNFVPRADVIKLFLFVTDGQTKKAKAGNTN